MELPLNCIGGGFGERDGPLSPALPVHDQGVSYGFVDHVVTCDHGDLSSS